MRWTASVFARAIYFWRSVSPVCRPSKSGWHRYPNVRPLTDWVWRMRGWVFWGPNIHLIGFPCNKGKRILFGWKGILTDMSSVSFLLPFFTLLLEGLHKVSLGDIHSQPEQVYRIKHKHMGLNPKCSKWNTGSPTKLHHPHLMRGEMRDILRKNFGTYQNHHINLSHSEAIATMFAKF